MSRAEQFHVLGRQRVAAIAHLLWAGERVEDHGLMRVRRGRGWRPGFMVITQRRLIWCDEKSRETLVIPFREVTSFRGLTKIATADLFLETPRERLRFNGGKIFVPLVVRALSRGPSPLG